MLTLKEATELAFNLGNEAAKNGESRAPVMNEELMTMLRENKGIDWTPPLQAYARGYQAFIDAKEGR